MVLTQVNSLKKVVHITIESPLVADLPIRALWHRTCWKIEERIVLLSVWKIYED